MWGKLNKASLVAGVMLLVGVVAVSAFASSASGFTDGTTLFTTSAACKCRGRRGFLHNAQPNWLLSMESQWS